MIKSKNGYFDIKLNDINKVEEDKPNLVTCTSYNQNECEQKIKNQNINDKSSDFECSKIRITRNTSKQKNSNPDYEHRYTDEREQIIKNKSINDKSFDFECPKIRITRNTSKQKIYMNNVKKDMIDNSLRCSSFNDKINNFNKAHKEKLPKKQNLIVSKKKKNHEQMNECTLLTNTTHTEKNASNTNTDEKINKKTIIRSNKKKSLISNINKNNNTLTCSNTYEEINPSTSITHKDTNTLTTNILNSNTHNKINMITTNTQTSEDKNTLTSNINNDKNTSTSNTHEEIIPLRSNILTRNKKKSLISNKNKDKNTLTRSTHKEIFPLTTNTHTNKEKNALISNIINKDENALTSHINNDKNTLNSNTHKEINTLTTNILTRKRKHSLISNTNKDKNTFIGNSSKNNYVLTRNKNKNTITTNTPSTILASKTNVTPSIKNCVNKFIGVEDDIIDNDTDQNHTDHRDGESSDVTNNVNLVKDYMISTYCKKNWPTVLDELRDNLNGKKVFDSILFNKVYEQMIRKLTKTKLLIKKMKGINNNWKLKFECLEFKMKKLEERIKCYINSRHNSIQNQNQMDITCKSIGVGEIENNSDINKKVPTDLQNNITPENFKTPKLYQHSINGENENLTESVPEIKTTKYKEIKMNIPSTQVIADLIKDIPLSPESLKSNKRNLTKSDTCITRVEDKIIKTQHSAIQNFDHIDVHIPTDTTASRISPKSFYTKNKNLTQFDSGIKMTQSKTIESNEQSTLVSTNVCPNTQILTQYDSEKETSEKIESNMINYYELSTPASIESTVNNPQVITTSGLCYSSLSNQKIISTQYCTDIKKTKSKIMESTLAHIDLTVESPPDMRASSVSPNMLNGQSSLTQCNTQLESYEPSTLASIDSTVNNPTSMMYSRLSIGKNIFTQYNNGGNVISSTSMSTDLSSNIPTISLSLREITPNGNPAMIGRPNVEVLVLNKDDQLSTTRITGADWQSCKILTTSQESACVPSLPVAIKRPFKPNLSPPSNYPMLNKLLTKPISKIPKLD